MKRMGMVGWLAAALLAVVGVTGSAIAQQPPAAAAPAGVASVHGHVNDAAGTPLGKGEVRLTTDRHGDEKTRKYDYIFPVDPSGNYTGTGVKPGNYVAMYYQGTVLVDFLDNQIIAANDDKAINIDMTRPAYIAKMSPDEKAALEELKKKNAEAMAANNKIANLNSLLIQARSDIKAGNFDPAVKSMTDATNAKPDESILWQTLGDAELGQANALDKAARAAHATDASLPGKYSAAADAYQKALELNAAAAKPSKETEAAADNQLGQVYAKLGKTTEAAAAYEAAVKAEPAKAGMYYFNEAATLYNASLTSGKEDGIVDAADKAIAADPTKAEAYYIKTQALAPLITTTPQGKFVPPAGLVDACNKYLELAPTGPHADDMKALLSGLGEQIKTTYKAPGKK